MDAAVAVVLLLAGGFHLLPGVAVRSPEAVARLYGVPVPDADAAVLLRHRAVLLALVGLVLVAGALRDEVRPLALVVGILSTSSYVWLARGADPPPLRRVLRIDVVLLALLAAAAVAAAR